MKVPWRFLGFAALALILFTAGGLALFIATWKADAYRPMLVSRLQTLAGRPVTLGRISVGFRGGLALAFEELTVASDSPGELEPALRVEKGYVNLKLLPLVRRRLEFSSLSFLRPTLRIIHHDLQGALPSHPSSGKPGSAQRPVPPVETLQPLPRSFYLGESRAAGIPLEIRQLEIEGGKVTYLRAGKGSIPAGGVSLEGVRLEARGVGGRLEIQNLSARLAEGTITLRGFVEMAPPPARGVRGEVEIDLQALPLHRLLPPPQPKAPSFRGNLSSPQKIQIQTGEGGDGMPHLRGGGSLRIEQGRIENLNVLAEVFRRLSVLPGLAGRLLERLPESYRKKLEAKDTVLEPMTLDLRLEGEVLVLQRIRVATEDFELTGEGRIRLSDRALEMPALLRIEPEFSAALIRSVEEFQVLTDPEGRLRIPVRLQGELPRLAVMPDLESIGAQLLAGRVQDLVGGLLRKALE